MSSDNFPLYDLQGVGKEYPGPGGSLAILKGLDLRVERGESVAVLGASGAGKSTLLHVLGGLDVPTAGKVLFEGRDVARMGEPERAHLRNREMGFVFQFHHLLPEFSTLENVAMPGLIAGLGRAGALARAAEALELVALDHRAAHKVTTLSGGERQRAAIARAILMRPKALLADEPTGNLDEATGGRIGTLLFDLNKELGMTLVVVTHNVELAARMGRRLELRSGELYEHDR
ncbi:ABC transporter ATP-binding protein [Desulfocurvus sp.]|jgi:lipoprotein-releasing system ATP-binding protein|uniref:ABC transporter ATP-binding protein n=1 Tax=Desulfocurvus sp. TaxID=2871698 RepID=UPI0025C06544|nr:ABC transporter ATP-binding protein [Desulfocurvus sp.]MCK9240966.1 ABC transporter ATP-binding protein [Desulfocurvus sp.]